MDEPTAALSDREIERLFTIVRRLASGRRRHHLHLASNGGAVAHRRSRHRDARRQGRRDARGTRLSADEIIHAMVGRRLDAHFPELAEPPQGRARSSGRSRSCARRRRQRRELLGARRRDRRACGLDRRGQDRDRARDRRRRRTRSRRGSDRRPCACGPGASATAIAAGIAFITEDRKAQGLVLGMTVRENVTLAHLADVRRSRSAHRRGARARRDRRG